MIVMRQKNSQLMNRFHRPVLDLMNLAVSIDLGVSDLISEEDFRRIFPFSL